MRFHSDGVLMTTGQLTVVFPFVPNEVYLWSFVVLPTNLDQCDDAVPPSWIFILLLCHQPGSLFQWCVTNLDPCSSDMSQTWILVPMICHKLGSLFQWYVTNLDPCSGDMSQTWILVPVICHQLGSLFPWYVTNLDPCSCDMSQTWILVPVIYHKLGSLFRWYITNLDPCSGAVPQTWITFMALCRTTIVGLHHHCSTTLDQLWHCATIIMTLCPTWIIVMVLCHWWLKWRVNDLSRFGAWTFLISMQISDNPSYSGIMQYSKVLLLCSLFLSFCGIVAVWK